MKILLLGANGQLGRELNRKLPSMGEVNPCTRAEVDLSDRRSIRTAIDGFNPDIIVNAAAYTAVDKAEGAKELASRINAEAVAVLANEAAQRDIWLIHYSTDYVFNGSKKNAYSEEDLPNPINAYGASKLAGEKAISASGCKNLVFRTTWVVGLDGANFAKTILRLAQERDTLSIIDDQIGVPTTTDLISKVTASAVNAISRSTPWPTGLYHLAPHGQTTWFGMAQELLKLAQQQELSLSINESSLQPIKTVEYPTPAKRPANSLLDTTKLEQQLNFTLPHWKADFLKVAKELIREVKSV